MEIRRQVLGEQHPDFAISINNLAELYGGTGRYEEAEQLYRQAMEIRRQVLGEQHPDFAIGGPQQPGRVVPCNGAEMKKPSSFTVKQSKSVVKC